jgi:Telomeric repeat-binding factor 2.
MKKKIFIILAILLMVFVTGCSLTDENPATNPSQKPVVNKAFEFDDLEITVSDNISFVKLNNQFSDHNGKDVIKIPVTIKNIDDDENNSLNMFYYTAFNASGTEADNVSTYFMNEDASDYAGELRPGAEYTKYLYFIYEGDGKYIIEFDAIFGDKKELEINITK